MPSLDRSLIKSLPAFAELSDEELDQVVVRAHSARYAKNTEIFSQGEDALRFFLLLSGHIRVVQTSPEGHQVVARYINEGELFGIAVAMGLNVYPATAIAAVDCVALSWPNNDWEHMQANFPTVGAVAYRTVGSRLLDTQTRVMEMSSEQVEQRIAHTILRLVQQSGRKTDEGIEVDFPITRQEIAEMTGTTLHTVSRLLSAWEEEGLVRGGRQKVIVTDPHGLMLVSENRPRK